MFTYIMKRIFTLKKMKQKNLNIVGNIWDNFSIHKKQIKTFSGILMQKRYRQKSHFSLCTCNLNVRSDNRETDDFASQSEVTLNRSKSQSENR